MLMVSVELRKCGRSRSVMDLKAALWTCPHSNKIRQNTRHQVSLGRDPNPDRLLIPLKGLSKGCGFESPVGCCLSEDGSSVDVEGDVPRDSLSEPTLSIQTGNRKIGG